MMCPEQGQFGASPWGCCSLTDHLAGLVLRHSLFMDVAGDTETDDAVLFSGERLGLQTAEDEESLAFKELGAKERELPLQGGQRECLLLHLRNRESESWKHTVSLSPVYKRFVLHWKTRRAEVTSA